MSATGARPAIALQPAISAPVRSRKAVEVVVLLAPLVLMATGLNLRTVLFASSALAQRQLLIGVALVLVVAINFRQLRSAELGIKTRLKDLPAKLLEEKYYLLAAAAVAGVILVLGWHYGQVRYNLGHLRLPAILKLGYLPVVVVQQLILGCHTTPRLQKLAGRWYRDWLVAVSLAVMHWPNPVLLVLTFPLGWVSAQAYRRTGHPYAMVLAHWLMGASLATTGVIMRVGYRFWPQA